jgi:hypothetical protein
MDFFWTLMMDELVREREGREGEEGRTEDGRV